jgi:hypothetical protein
MQRRLLNIVTLTKKFLAFLQPKLKNKMALPQEETPGENSSFITRFTWLSLLFVFAFLAVRLFVSSGQVYIQSSEPVPNVHYVDSAGRNFLFRGGLPLTNNERTFNYPGLKRSVIEAGKAAGVSVPNDFFIIDVNLLNIENTGDRNRISVEHQFFQSNPTLGFIQVWGIHGTGLQATDPQLAGSRNYLGHYLDSWLRDGLSGRIEKVRQWLTGEQADSRVVTDLPIVIFVHCAAGCDRTGEFIGAYYLRYMNKSWQEMNALNQQMCPHNRPFNYRNYRAAQWYCLWLNLERGFSLEWYQQFPCSGK